MPGKSSTRNVTAPGRAWSLENIQALLDVLAGRGITEFEMEQQGVKIRVRRGNAGDLALVNGQPPSPSPVMATSCPAPLPAMSVPVSPPAPAAVEPAGESTEDLFIMKSPIVGTFYSASGPNAPPFAQVGDKVRVGQVLCIIEAMKLMNELESEVAGTIVRAYVENGRPVEYGQSLFAIEPLQQK
jgi:acetyl-CoA carboxylase biotin carboxyl carrier protein